MPTSCFLLPLTRANDALLNGRLSDAALEYLKALSAYPQLSGVISANLAIHRRHYWAGLRQQTSAASCLLGLQGRAVPDSVAPCWHAALRPWPFVGDDDSPAATGDTLAAFIDAASVLVSDNPLPLLVVPERDAASLLVSVLYKQVWGSCLIGIGVDAGEWFDVNLEGKSVLDLSSLKIARQELKPGLRERVSRLDVPVLNRLMRQPDDWRAKTLPVSQSHGTRSYAATATSSPETPSARIFLKPPRRDLRERQVAMLWVRQRQLQQATDAVMVGGLVIGVPGFNLAVTDNVRCALHAFTATSGASASHGPALLHGGEISRLAVRANEVCQGLHGFTVTAVRIESAAYCNGRTIRWRVTRRLQDGPATLVLRAFQFDARAGFGARLLNEQPLRVADVQLFEATLLNPLAPVLLALCADNGELIDCALYPYPSLLQGGIHQAEGVWLAASTEGNLVGAVSELLVRHMTGHSDGDGWVVGALHIDVSAALGVEEMVSPDLLEWLWCVFGIRCSVAAGSRVDALDRQVWVERLEVPAAIQSLETLKRSIMRMQQGAAVILQAQGIPTLGLLVATSGRSEQAPAPQRARQILITDRHLAQQLVSFPCHRPGMSDPCVIDYRARRDPVPAPESASDCAGADAMQLSPLPARPLAIVPAANFFNHSARLLMPLAPDALARRAFKRRKSGRVAVAITAAGLTVRELGVLLESLACQRDITLEVVVVIPAGSGDHSELRKYVQENYPALPFWLQNACDDNYAAKVQQASAHCLNESEAEFVLFINRAVLLHDPDTLACLVAMLVDDGNVATVGCAAVGYVGADNSRLTLQGGCRVPVRGADGWLVRDSAELTLRLPPSDLVTLAVADECFMVRASDWRQSGGFAHCEALDERALFEYCERQLQHGREHRFTSRVTLSRQRAETPWTVGTVAHDIGVRLGLEGRVTWTEPLLA